MNCTLVFFKEQLMGKEQEFLCTVPSVDHLGHLVLTEDGGAIKAVFAPAVWAGFVAFFKDEDGNA